MNIIAIARFDKVNSTYRLFSKMLIVALPSCNQRKINKGKKQNLFLLHIFQPYVYTLDLEVQEIENSEETICTMILASILSWNLFQFCSRFPFPSHILFLKQGPCSTCTILFFCCRFQDEQKTKISAFIGFSYFIDLHDI